MARSPWPLLGTLRMPSSPVPVALQITLDHQSKRPEICFGLLKAAESHLFQKWEEHAASLLRAPQAPSPVLGARGYHEHLPPAAFIGRLGGLQWEAVHTTTPACLSVGTFRISPGHESRTRALTQSVTTGLDPRAEALLGPKLRN